MAERYTIEVDDEEVNIYGDFTIEEIFDYLNFFDKKGYSYVCTKQEGLSIFKKDFRETFKEVKKQEAIEEDLFYKSMYQAERSNCVDLEKKVNQLENLIKEIMTESIKKNSELKEENQRLKKENKIDEMLSDPSVGEILERMVVQSEVSE